MSTKMITLEKNSHLERLSVFQGKRNKKMYVNVSYVEQPKGFKLQITVKPLLTRVLLYLTKMLITQSTCKLSTKG